MSDAPIALADYDYPLPPDRIAQRAPDEREAARMLVLDRRTGAIAHRRVRDLPCELAPADLVVVNATRVLPARLRGEKPSGGKVEALLLGRDDAAGCWRALLRHRGRQRVGQAIFFGADDARFEATVVAIHGEGEVTLALAPEVDPYRAGEMPLPPYVRRAAPCPADRERYQTLFARAPGSVAAPTAGLHFGPALLAALDARGIERAELVLHIGVGTFRPLRDTDLRAGRLHAERYELPAATAHAIARTRARGGRVVAIGTTTARVLETCAAGAGLVRSGHGVTDLFLRPGHRFQVVDALLTNFHLPRSSLLLLVCAYAGRERVLAAYAEAVERGYRFYSYGDAMWIA